jgi:hypothetical protein
VVAVLTFATAVPAAAITAVVITGGSEAGVLELRSPSATLRGTPPPSLPSPSVVTVGPPAVPGAGPAPDRTATAAARGSTRAPVPGARVGTTDGRLSFVAPQGWLYGLCPQGGDSCVEIAPTSLGGGDAIDVLVTDEAAGDAAGTGPGEWATGGGRLTVAGRPARQLELRSNASVLVYGAMPEAGRRFMVSCRYDRQEQLLRQACSQVVGTLQLVA